MKVFFSFAEARKYVTHGSFFISHRNVLFPFWWNLTGAREWTLFTPGRFDRTKPSPGFQRSSYAADLQHNVVSVFDPLLLRDEQITLGWFVGFKSVDHSAMLANLVLQLSEEFSFTGHDMVIFASSGGGMPALRIAEKFPHVSVYLSNIQTDPRKYYERSYRRLMRVAFPGMSSEEIDARYGGRLSSYKWDGEFRLVYAQNLSDEFHYSHHFLPFVEAGYENERQMSVQFLTYEDPESGHGVLSRKTELGIIGAMHQGLDVRGFLPQGRALRRQDSKG